MPDRPRAFYIANCIWRILDACETPRERANAFQVVGAAIEAYADDDGAQSLHEQLIRICDDYEAPSSSTQSPDDR